MREPQNTCAHLKVENLNFITFEERNSTTNQNEHQRCSIKINIYIVKVSSYCKKSKIEK
jgi:hypothetical protein